MHIDKEPISDLSVPPNDFTALRSALDAQNTPPAVEKELMAAFAARFPPQALASRILAAPVGHRRR